MLAAPHEFQFEQDIEALAAVWFDPRRSRAQAELDADEWVQTRHHHPHVVVLSQALGAMRVALSVLEQNPPRYVEQALARVRAAGWPRAIRLAEAAWACAQAFAGRQACQRGLDLLHSHDGHDDGQETGLLERLCTQTSLLALHAIRGEFDAALAHGLQAQALAGQRGFDLLSSAAVQGLNYVFLSVGDIEAAECLLRSDLDTLVRMGLPKVPRYYNLLLCKIIAGHHEEAAAMFEAQPWLVEETSQATSALSDMLALVRANQGDSAEADRLLARAPPDWMLTQAPIMANRAWIRAAAYLALNRPQAARDEVENFLAHLAATVADDATPLTPMNATQLYRLRSEACEALGDLKTALAALKDSRESCFSWVSESVKARLNVLHAAAPLAASEKQSGRVAAVAAAVEQARTTAAEPADAIDERLRRQRQFLSHVTHEMRNPLNGMLGMTSLLMMSNLDERQRKYLNLARSSAEMLMSLCNNVLDLAKIDAGRFELQPQDVDLSDLVGETVEILQAQVQLRGIGLNHHVDPALPSTLWCDRLRVQQVLMNLLNNAAKFTRAGRIDIQVLWNPPPRADEPGELRIEVRDTGIGISPEGQARLFQEFSQVHAAGQQLGGTGLGLALCRSLVGSMGGRIGMHSVQGQGSTFWFTLPLWAGAPQIAATNQGSESHRRQQMTSGNDLRRCHRRRDQESKLPNRAVLLRARAGQRAGLIPFDRRTCTPITGSGRRSTRGGGRNGAGISAAHLCGAILRRRA